MKHFIQETKKNTLPAFFKIIILSTVYSITTELIFNQLALLTVKNEENSTLGAQQKILNVHAAVANNNSMQFLSK